MTLTARSSAASRTHPSTDIQGLSSARRLFQGHRAPEANHITATLITAEKRESTVDRTEPVDPAQLLAWARALAEEHLAPGDGQRLRLRVWAAGGRRTLGSVTLRRDRATRTPGATGTHANVVGTPLSATTTSSPDASSPSKPQLLLGAPPGLCPRPPERETLDAPQRAALEEEVQAFRAALQRKDAEGVAELDEAREALTTERRRADGLAQRVRRYREQARRVPTLEAQVERQAAQLSERARQLKGAESKLAAAHAEAEATRTALQDARRLERTVTALGPQLEATKARIEALEQQLRDAHGEVRTLTRQLGRVEAERDGLKADLEEHQEAVTTLMEQRADLQRRLKEANDDYFAVVQTALSRFRDPDDEDDEDEDWR